MHRDSFTTTNISRQDLSKFQLSPRQLHLETLIASNFSNYSNRIRWRDTIDRITSDYYHSIANKTIITLCTHIHRDATK